MSTNAQLEQTVRAAAGGDERAWIELFTRFTPVLRHVARGFRLAPHDVDDVVQACWLSLLTNIHTLNEPAAVGGWLVTTARRHALRSLQRGVREVIADEPVAQDVPAPSRVEAAVEDAERIASLRDALQRLPGRQRALLEAMVADPGCSYLDVSRRLRMPIGSIGPTRERGLHRLRQDRTLVAVVTS
jgi:RNA polymerase sigma factor (sigma-70 family)